MENAPLMINGKNVDFCNIQELQQFAKDTKGKPDAIQFIGKPEPLLRGYIKAYLRKYPEIAEQNRQTATLVVVKGLTPDPPKTPEPQSKKATTKKPDRVGPNKYTMTDANAHKKRTGKTKKEEVKKSTQAKPMQKVADESGAEKIVEPERKKKVKRPYTRPLTATEIERLLNKADVKKILKAETKLHVKFYKLNQAGYSRKQIAAMCDTSEGHVWNELERYKDSQRRRDKADAVKV